MQAEVKWKPRRVIILFVILQQFADWEAAYLSSALTMLGQGQYEIKTVSLSKDPVSSIGGFQVLPDFDTASVPGDYEALLLIGWYSVYRICKRDLTCLASSE